MCRALVYIGKPILMNSMLFKTDNSLITQTYNPKLMTIIQNLAGFGAIEWSSKLNSGGKPLIYKSIELPFFDKNLASIAECVTSSCFMAHIRGVLYQNQEIVSPQNNHPFLFEGTNVALCHNGSLYGIQIIRDYVYSHVPAEITSQIKGTTDSEIIYALFLSKLKDKYTNNVLEVQNAVLETLDHISILRKKHSLNILSPVNLFISNGDYVIATRYSFDYGHLTPNIVDLGHFTYHSLWYTVGDSYKEFEQGFAMSGKKSSSIIISSEPLTEDMTSWIELPEYSLISAQKNEKSTLDIDIINIEI